MNLVLIVGLLFMNAPEMRFVATADSVKGLTASGAVARQGIVAADPAILPLGSVIRVAGAGAYSGTYVVSDTGSKIVGRRIDIFVPSHLEARQFGRKRVVVRLVSRGNRPGTGRGASARAFAP